MHHVHRQRRHATPTPATLTITVGGRRHRPRPSRPRRVAFGTGRVDETAPLRVTWSGHGRPRPASPRTRSRRSVAGRPFRARSTPAPAPSISKLYRFKQLLVFRVRATDTEGNCSGVGHVLGAARSSPSRTATRRVVVHAARWTCVGPAGPRRARGYAVHDHQGGATAQLTFTGSQRRCTWRPKTRHRRATSRSTSTARSSAGTTSSQTGTASAGSSPASPGGAWAPHDPGRQRPGRQAHRARRLHRPQVARTPPLRTPHQTARRRHRRRHRSCPGRPCTRPGVSRSRRPRRGRPGSRRRTCRSWLGPMPFTRRSAASDRGLGLGDRRAASRRGR